MTAKRWMIYGANGYTGRRIAHQAASSGLKPVLAGRDEARIQSLATELGCESRVFSLAAPTAITEHLRGVAAVLHCAGPFSVTARPMLEACLTAGVHYLDITGEIDVIELAARFHQRAEAAGVCLMPAVGMDVVPSDCLAAQLAAMLPEAVKLELAFTGMQSISHGTAATIWENVGRGGRVRRGGQIIRVPVAWKVQSIPFFGGPKWGMTIPWGDVSSAFHTTGVPDIEVYTAVPRGQLRVIRAFRGLASLASLKPIQAAGRWWIDRQVRGPGADELRQGRTEFWGRVTDGAGRSVEATLETPNGYTLTVQASLAILHQVLAGNVRPGFATPARALGGGFIESLPDIVFRRPGTARG